MSFVDHFTLVQVLEQACVRLLKGATINFSLLSMDHRRMVLPNWETMEAIIHQLTWAEPMAMVEKYIAHLKAHIEEYETEDSIPGMAAQYQDSVVLPFQEQLKPNPDHPPMHQVVLACFHCEATLVAVMAYLATDSKHDLGPLFEACSHLLPIMIVS
jgi:hypothetical protein